MHFFEFAREHPGQRTVIKMKIKEGIYYVVDLFTI